jgi:hypothetical protein
METLLGGTEGRFSNQAKQAIRNGKAARATYIRAGAARLLSQVKAGTARLLAWRPKAALGL